MNIDVICTFEDADGSDEQFEDFLDSVLDELEKIGREDIDFSASITQRKATFTVFGADEADPEIDKFHSDLRTALHAAHCITEGWEKPSLSLRADSENSALV
ncbi:hypothetical protein ASE27_10080 [Oerskovia sp. Root918]|uniref:hypothetical protein n=1 Tax=Oerskovia sp. Root918 TaxID=1736607 RepID=UPI0006F577D7|nr:hypothetical protein [Oerskovia sp. Root918]KRD36794.1 hypothetical protein ASE27_10080 [Oerskovia sp. Root918]